MAISEEITVEVTGVKSVSALADALDKAAASAARLRESMGGGGAGSGASGAANMARSMDAAAAKMEASAGKMEASLAKLKAAGAEAGAAMADIGKAGAESAAGLGDAAKGANEAAASYARLGKASRDSAAMMDEQAVAGKRAAKSSAEGAAGGAKFWGGLKTVMLGAGVAAAYGIGNAMKFQSQMLLLHTQAGVSVKDTQAMSKGALLISTQTGQSLSNVAESAYHVASNMESMGTSVPRMLQAVKISAEGAAVGHSNMVDTTNALTAAIASGIPGVKNYQQAMGVLNATVGAGDMSMQDLSEAFGTGMVASVKGYGLSIKDVGAGLAVLGDNNIRGAKAGTDFRMAVQSLAVPAKSAKKELAALGLTQNSLANDMQHGGLLKALGDLHSKFKSHGITAKNEGQVITDLFGKKAGTGLSILMEQYDRLLSKYPALTEGANNFNKAWKATQATPAQKWKELTAGLKASATGFGTELLPSFTKAVGFADKLLADINGSKNGAKAMAVAFGGIAALFTAKKLTSGIESAFKTAEVGLRFTGKIAQTIGIPGADKLANVGKAGGSAAATGGLDALGSAASRAAGALNAVGAAGEKAAAGESAAGSAGAKEAIGESAAGSAGAKEAIGETAAGTAGGKLGKGGLGGVIGTVAIAAIISDLLIKHLENKKDPKVLGNTNPKSPWNSWESNNSAGGKVVRFLAHQNTPVYGPQGVLRGRGGGGPPPLFIVPHPAAAPSSAVPMLGAGGHPFTVKPKVEPPDTGAISSALRNIGHLALKPVKMPGPDMSALDAAKGKAQAAGTAITSALTGALGKPVHAKSPDLSAYASAAGKASADGANISAGLAAGIESGKSAVAAAAADVAGAAAAAMAVAVQSHSPSKKTKKTGKDMTDGLVLGLQGGQDAVNAAATALGQGAAKATDIAAIDNTTKKLLSEVPKGDTALTRMLKADNRDLDRMAKTRAKIEQEISSSEQVAKSAISGASIMNSLNAVNPAGAEPIASSAIVTGQGYQASSMKQFAQQLTKLQAMGLNATSLSQIAQAGPDQGLGIAQGITSGGKGAIRQLNQLQKQMQASAAQIGNVAGPAMYQAGKDMGAGLATGLKSELKSLDKAMEHLAKSMVASVEHHTKHAKGKAAKAAAGAVAAGAGAGSGSGPGAGGGDGGLSHAAAALSGAAAALTSAAAALHKDATAGTVHAHPVASAARGGAHLVAAAAAGGGHGGGGTVHNITNVTVHGTVTAERDLLNTLQQHQLRKANSNWQGGWKLPGRAT